MIHWSCVFYTIVTLCYLVVIVHNFISSYGGGSWYGGKKRYELDFVGWINIAFFIIWTLVWGGFFWW